MKPTNRVAVSLALEDTESTLEALRELGGFIGLAEIRLDLMQRFDLERLVIRAPCPLIMTCRPLREGGNFGGTEAERLELLSRASALGCAFVDVEWDCVSKFDNRRPSTRLIVSRHYFNQMPEDPWALYLGMRSLGDVVKLAGVAARTGDSIPMLQLAARADTPVIPIAMGEAGMITRLLAPCFDACLLTYASRNHGAQTAPGQIGAREMVDKYGIDRVSSATEVEVCVYTRERDEKAVRERCGGDGRRLRLPVRVEAGEADVVCRALSRLDPRVSVIGVDALLAGRTS